MADIDQVGAEAVAAEVGRDAMAVRLDVTRQDDINAAVTAAVARFGRKDILINNAGIFDLAGIADITRSSYARGLAVKVEGLHHSAGSGEADGHAREAGASSISRRRRAVGAKRWWPSAENPRPR